MNSCQQSEQSTVERQQSSQQLTNSHTPATRSQQDKTVERERYVANGITDDLTAEGRSEVEQSLIAARYLASKLTFQRNGRGRFPHEDIPPAAKRIVQQMPVLPASVVAMIASNDESGAELLARFIETNVPEWNRPHAENTGGPRPKESLWMRIYRKLAKALKQRVHQSTFLAAYQCNKGNLTGEFVRSEYQSHLDRKQYFKGNRINDIASKTGLDPATIRRHLKRNKAT